ncbi:Metallothiol transferase fosB [Quillaja saponaria]|uniref:Metallothiol transferase fosB n=1 Tax=Quillaja saponaria TaxID=32244 RepID=A0AAD7KWU6_QUISA|nr:Metallothiol transferase fosB [Quillaja saponaria]
MEDVQMLSCASATKAIPFLSLNHVSFVCKCVTKSVKFYEDILGFVLIKRPSSFNFEGAWLFNYGIGIHLLESNNLPVKKEKINPKDNHISFQCSDMKLVMQKLEEMNIENVTAVVQEGGIEVDQLFFHDPDGYMIEICNCQKLPVLPLSSCPLKRPDTIGKHEVPVQTLYGARSLKMQCAGEVAVLMMENLVVDMMNISI